MSSQKEFVQFIVEGLAPLGTVTAKRMFGGDGIFREGLMFGLVSEDTLYFKVDECLREEYTQLECEPFTYTRQGKLCHLSYFSVPTEALEDPETLRQWALKSWQVAVHTHRQKSKSRPPSPQQTLRLTKTRH